MNTRRSCSYDNFQRVCFAHPDALVSPRSWIIHGSLLGEALSGDFAGDIPHSSNNDTSAVHLVMQENFDDVKVRNETMLFQNLPPKTLATLASTVADIEVSI